ncbi:MAG: hybrid sensor histidine kinase/response regulator [Luteolibacter sp.]
MEIPAPFHVLLIEDSPEDRADLRQMMLHGSLRHYKFTEAETGTAGIRAVLAHLDSPPDCILLDYNLPDMNALEVLAALRAGGDLTVCPVVVVTGSMEWGTRIMDAGAQEVVGKTWATPESVTRAIDSAVERYVSNRGRLATEAALRLAHERLTLAVECSQVVLFQQDLDLRYTWMLNPAPGFDGSDAIGKRDTDLMELVEDADLAEALKREVIRSGVAKRQEVLMQIAGVGRHYDLLLEPLRDAADRITGLTGAAIDITERKGTEEALRHNERRFRGIFDSAFQFIGLMTPDGTLLEANETALEAGGLRAENVIGKPFWECDWWTLTEQTGQELRSAIGRAASGEMVRYDVDVRGGEGQVVTIDFSIKPIRDEAGRVVLLIPEGRDITDLKRVEEALRARTVELETLLDTLPAFVWISRDAECREIVGNRTANELVGVKTGTNVSQSAVTGGEAPYFRQLKEDGTEYWVEELPLQRAVATGLSVRNAALDFYFGDGRRAHVVGDAVPLFDDQGRIRGGLAVFVDITERKLAEEARHEMERNYRALAAASSEIAYRMSADWSTMLSLDGRQLVTSSDQALADWAWLDQNIPLDEHPRIMQAINEAIAHKTLFEMEHGVRRPDGSVGWTFSRAVPILDGNEEVVAWFGAASDITERKHAEAAVARLAAIVECSYDALLSEDLDGIVTSWNRGAEQIFGYRAEEIIGTSIMRLIPEDGRAAEHELQREIVTGKRGGTFEATRQAKDGREFHASITVSPMTDAAGKIIGTSRVIRDITQRRLVAESLREAKEAAEAANRSKDRFLAALSHELRTPLTPVLLVSEVHAKSDKLPKDLREDFEMIHRNIVLEAQLIDDLLDVSRIKQGKMRFDFKLVDVHEAIPRALEMLHSEVKEKNITLRQKLVATPATLEADPARLRQVLCNLLRNAVKFTPHGGTITVHTACDSSVLQISITDTGAGIAAGDLERIFQPFEQVDAQQKSEHVSLGLGLAISQAIIAAHRGRIWAESPGPNQGATFHVRIPFEMNPNP